MNPNFLFIGADKSGSTWLYEILRAHPECYVPTIKDIYYFDRQYDRGLNWYLSFFKHAETTHKAVGELSHDYLFSGTAADRIANDFPNIKLMACLRNPVDRTFSNYLFLIRSGITRKPFEEALDIFPELINNSLYFKYINYYNKIFDSEQLKILFFHHLDKDPISFAKDVFDFLGLSFIENINYEEKVIPSSRPRSFILSSIIGKGADIARRMRMETLVGRMKTSSLRQLLYIPHDPAKKPEMSHDTRINLNAIFEDDIRMLQDLLQEDLSDWLELKSADNEEIQE